MSKIYVPKVKVKGVNHSKENSSDPIISVGTQDDLISLIEDMQKNGWEVYGDIYKSDGKLIYDLRKKKN